ncbi:MAG: hypothetical protein JKY67_23255 [Pseudomonadales bacterium]|nr:hypothetical protein [Pseudomonadales bacterium]
MKFALRALPGLKEWPSIKERAFNTRPGQKSHILIIIDRENMDNPLELIVAHSESPIMNQESIRSIVDNYLDA